MKNNPLNVVNEPTTPIQEPVETKLVIIFNHMPIETTVLKEALFEIRQNTKNIVRATLTKYGIERLKDVQIFL